MNLRGYGFAGSILYRIFDASASTSEIGSMADLGIPYMIAATSQQTRDIIAPRPDDFPTVWSLTPSYDAYETELVPVVEGLAAAGKPSPLDPPDAPAGPGPALALADAVVFARSCLRRNG